MCTSKIVLVTGATGYIGGRLVPRLLEEGYAVRVLVRDASRLQGREWRNQVQIFEGDVLNPESIFPALQGAHTAYYLIHSMMGGRDFHQRDIEAAQNFAVQARRADLRRIVYLGGLGDPQADLSKHLRSRQETADALRSSGVPVTEFRAGIVVGAGSISFEMIRYLAERVPVMISPRWVYTRIQPISIQNVLDYLAGALELIGDADHILEIGGPEVMTYEDMLRGYSEERGLKRWIVPVPFLTPRLSSYWVHWVTPIPAVIARPLIEGLRNEVIVRDETARRVFPNIRLIPYQQAVRMTLNSLEAQVVETSWSDAQGESDPVRLSTHEGMILERRMLDVPAPAENIYQSFSSLGGEQGWLYANWIWRLRGLADRLLGGVGFRRGRRSPDTLRVGDAVDFWRVENLVPNSKLLLRAEMKVPGRAWLQFEAIPVSEKRTILVQTAFFAPKGLSGLLYWYLLYPIHGRIFSGLIRRVAERALRLDKSAPNLKSFLEEPQYN
ncbi:MAG: SDR family oxidoreductase [Anaerolineales bacterium]|jgi:uncharacterized protein YbjT (DUF2867 family)